MLNDQSKDHKKQKKERHHRDEKHCGKEHRSRNGGAKTFRRGRALAFLEKLEGQRSTLKRQLETPELQSINPILVGELKATESIIDEFIRLFEIYETSRPEDANESQKKTEPTDIDDEKSTDEFK